MVDLASSNHCIIKEEFQWINTVRNEEKKW
jgi:hypothetical protein